jgi:hypothetical protein
MLSIGEIVERMIDPQIRAYVLRLRDAQAAHENKILRVRGHGDIEPPVKFFGG